jgi:hypothetical protein
MLETLICWNQCILDIYFALLFQLLKKAFQVCEMLTLFPNKDINYFYDPSITYKDNHFAKTCIKI